MKYETRVFLYSFVEYSTEYSSSPVSSATAASTASQSAFVRPCVIEKRLYSQSGYVGRW